MLLAAAALPLLALCFSHNDIELFKLRDLVAQDISPDTTFYSWLGVKEGAGRKEIVKAYRKLSRAIHPDRNPGVEATERFARLNKVYKILQSPVRETYDGYLRSGFPTLNKETGEYVYRRFRPNFFVAFFLVTLLFTAVEFVVRKVNASRQRNHIENIVANVQDIAKQNSSTPGVIVSKTDVQVGPNTLTVHPTGDVYLGSEKIEASSISDPMWQDTVLGKMVVQLQRLAKGEKAAAVAEPVAPADISEEELVEVSEEVQSDSTKSKKGKPTEHLSKGAARRRPAAARAKAKLF